MDLNLKEILTTNKTKTLSFRKYPNKMSDRALTLSLDESVFTVFHPDGFKNVICGLQDYCIKGLDTTLWNKY